MVKVKALKSDCLDSNPIFYFQLQKLGKLIALSMFSHL